MLFFLNQIGAVNAAEVSSCQVCVSAEEAQKIAQMIWRNECAGTLKGLTTWNQGEDFASLGIGHFIWYPRNKSGPFKEMFPDLVAFLSRRKVVLPQWLRDDKGCPWSSREEFQQAQESPKMQELRQLLADTIALQAEFMANRLQKSLPAMLNKFAEERRERVVKHFNSLLNDPMGLYALLDYLNFKGEGLLPSETYKGEGWGLIQVLEQMNDSKEGERAVVAFAEAANDVLERRVANSPPERNEKRWLKGWQNRISSYLK